MPDKNKISNSSKKYEYNNNNHIKFQQYEDKNLIIFDTNLNIENLRKSYNILNRGVDKINQNLNYYNIQKKFYKWWKKIFFLV